MPYLVLDPDVALRRLEEPYLYHRGTDELYQLSEEAWDYLLPAAGGAHLCVERADPDFVEYLVGEGLAATCAAPPGIGEGRVHMGEQPSPSLRYLELYLTERCNLSCRHCFLGGAGRTDLPIGVVGQVLEQFDRMGGLRLLLTGGEAVLHPAFWELNELVPRFGFRTVLLSNGTCLEESATRLRVHEVQVSLDGLEAAHDALRGNGSFRRAMSGLTAASAAGLDVSIATMATTLNRGDFSGLGEVARRLGARAWSVDAPTPCGTLLDHHDLLLAPWEVAPYLDHSFGGGMHASAPGTVCGSHLMAVFADGTAAKCGFYRDEAVGHVEEGLARLWERVPRPPLASLACRCEYLETCRGGCRFRASVYNRGDQPDPVQCYRLGVLKAPRGEGGTA